MLYRSRGEGGGGERKRERQKRKNANRASKMHNFSLTRTPFERALLPRFVIGNKPQPVLCVYTISRAHARPPMLAV